MRILTFTALLIVGVSGVTTASAQGWNFGVLGGGSLLSSVNATGSAGSAMAGFAPGLTAGVFASENLYKRFSGEIHYDYTQDDLRLSSGGQTAQFSGMAHAFHYDVFYHTGDGESRVQFFAEVGGGIKVYMGTGTEEAYQPLSQYGYFTKTQTAKAMGTAGIGFTCHISSRVLFRAEVSDAVTAFPTAVLTPPPGVKYGSILQQVVPELGIVYSK